ncbi:hypothetical protein, partial [Mycoplasmoides pneumoniae]
PSNPYRFAVLLVPRSVVYYEQLQRGLALPNQGSSSGSDSTNQTGAMFGLKVKDAQKDDQKSSEYLSGEAGSQAGGSTQGTS